MYIEHTMQQIFQDLFEEDLGFLIRGQMIMLLDVDKLARQSLTVHVLHCLFPCLDYFMKICLYMVAGILKWSESKFDVSYLFIEAA